MTVSDPGINLVLGPVILGIIVNTFVYGILFMQGVTYYTSSRFKQDRPLIKGLVTWSLSLDTFHSCAVILVVWEYCIEHFGDQAFLETTPWPYPTSPIFTTSTSVPIQVYLAYRVKRLSKSWAIFGGITALSVTSGIIAWISSIRAVRLSDTKEFPALIPIVDTWLALSALCDVSLTILLFIFLRRGRTGFSKTDNIITTLILQSIETAAFSSLTALMNLITFTVIQKTNFHFIFSLLAGRMYTNTLLATLNSRDKLRADILVDGANTLTSPPSHGVAVHVSVEHREDDGTEMEDYTKRNPQKARGLDTYYV
ncbi:hypothetical protein C8F04DRAFT_67070 [Mycena alexandri]|uniref:DUF6534 domain-containing protein n=1 Tax=Mycena alexandri TaxID=1745969 RepID=A0AAD6WYQ1_9AGAR|nr:hypothetical protein C8F04DRAFT_67070 [Mycena alexandri]